MKDSLYLAPKQGVPGSLTTISGILLENKETFLRWINTFLQLFKLGAGDPGAWRGRAGIDPRRRWTLASFLCKQIL